MHIFEYGSGAPLVLVPGIQGRWEYMRPSIDALSRFFRVITFPLCGEPASKLPFDPHRGFENYVSQVAEVLTQTQLDRAVICGVSFGGVVALQFAAAHPDRTAALVLASTPAPRWQLRRRHEIYVGAPRFFGPIFFAQVPWRVRAEMAAALPEPRARWAFRRAMLRTFVTSPLSASRIATRARLMHGMDLRSACARVAAPTLVVTGEPGLDHVVRVSGSSEYARLIPNARAAVLERTGHLGAITRPDAFADLVRDFVEGHRHAAA